MEKIKAYMKNPGNFGPEEIAGIWPTNPSKYFEWSESQQDISIWCDAGGGHNPYIELLNDIVSSKSKYKIMVLIEPVNLCPKNYEWVLNNHHLFDLIFSTYPLYGDGNPKFKYYHGGLRSYIDKNDFKIYDKVKNICSIMSNKNYMPGHILRHDIKNTLNSIDLNLIDYINPPIDRKVDGLKDYRFELVIENEDSPFFSEKLIDSILCGCIPIYWSNTDASYLDVFDKNGIEIFKNKEDLIRRLSENYFSTELYESKKESIRNNFLVAQNYISLGDVLWNYGLKELLGDE
jgi:hypothetical protein